MKPQSACKVIALAAILLASASQDAMASDAAKIRALYVRLSKAFKAKDIKGILATGTKDFTNKQIGGPVMDTKTTAKMMEAQFKSVRSVDSVVMKPVKITVKGNKAVVMSTYSMVAKMDMGDGKIHQLSDTGTATEHLVRTRYGWRFRSTEMLTMNPKMDGNPLPMEAAGATKK